MTTYFTEMESPIGTLRLISDGTSLIGLDMLDGYVAPNRDWIRCEDQAPLVSAKTQLTEYFAGTRTRFDLPLRPQGTPFQRTVWQELTRIGYGETTSYGEMARRIGNPNASRAVGLANGRNPIAVIVPCHRVIGASGKLVGYGGGLGRKKILLELEAGVLARANGG